MWAADGALLVWQALAAEALTVERKSTYGVLLYWPLARQYVPRQRVAQRAMQWFAHGSTLHRRYSELGLPRVHALTRLLSGSHP